MTDETSTHQPTTHYAFRLTFNPEILRIIAYLSLLLMLGVGSILTHIWVDVEPHHTAIYKLFGFNHACNVLDHEPSRTVSAMLLPFWEIPFLLYVTFNFLRIQDAFRERKAPGYTFWLAAAFLPIEVLLTVWFRLVFVWSPEVSFLNHYLPYVGFQILLCLVAVENVLYFDAMNALPFNNSRVLALAYVGLLLGVTLSCVLVGLSVALGHPILDLIHHDGQRLFFQALSKLYFILAIPVPLCLSWLELKRSPTHRLSVE